MYAYDTDRFGGVTLYTPSGEDFLYLQPGDDANTFLREIETLDKVWRLNTRRPRRKIGPLFCYEQHLSALIDQYHYSH